ncbi:MAG: T9SS type A sorting domain-containing protein [Bacteroidia bacterium]|nr:T9SS type A sorting domain-containing protein [Bacteroidia bacterium]
MARENLEMILGSGTDLNPVGTDIKLYPNPSDGKIVISTSNLPGNLIIIVFNQTGEKVFSSQLTGSANSSRNLDLSHLVDGVYTVLIVSDNLVFTDKIVIIKK